MNTDPHVALKIAARKLVRGQKGYGVYTNKSATKASWYEQYKNHLDNMWEFIQFLEMVKRETGNRDTPYNTILPKAITVLRKAREYVQAIGADDLYTYEPK